MVLCDESIDYRRFSQQFEFMQKSIDKSPDQQEGKDKINQLQRNLDR